MKLFQFWFENGFCFDPRWFPTALIFLDIAAAIGYAATDGFDAWRKVVYWFAAATLTAVVTW